MRKRPQDFYGPDDYYGQDVDEEIARIKERQDEWDKEYAALPWWRKLFI